MDEALWAVGRGTGIVGLALITVSVVLGILTRSGRPAFGLPRFAVTLVHRNAAILGTMFILIHIVTLLFDPYAQLELIDFVVPFLGEANPIWLGLGTVAFDLLLAVMVTGMLRNRIGRRTFRVVHWATYAMWPISLVHALGTGTDAASWAFITFAVVCTAAVVAALAWRLTPRFGRPIPAESAFVPRESALVPRESASLPRESAFVPRESAFVPHESALVPHESASVPHESASAEALDHGARKRP